MLSAADVMLLTEKNIVAFELIAGDCLLAQGLDRFAASCSDIRW